MFSLRQFKRTRRTRRSRKAASSRRSLSFQALEPRLLLSHKGPCPGSPHCPGGEEPPPETAAADPAIAYIQIRNSGRDTFQDLMVMNADGSNQTAVLSEKFEIPGFISFQKPDWSPDLDGDPTTGYQGTIAVQRHTTEPPLGIHILLVDVSVINGMPQASNVRVLVDKNDPSIDSLHGDLAAQPAWSPDLDTAIPGYQGQVAFSTIEGIFVIDVAWDGGTSVAFVHNSSTKLYQAPGQEDGSTRSEVWYPTWDPDGSRLAFQQNRGRGSDGTLVASLLLINPDDPLGTEPSVAVPEGVVNSFRSLDWSRTDNRVAFTAWGGDTHQTAALHTVDVDLGPDSLQKVPGGAKFNNRSPSWSSDDPDTTGDETDQFLVFSGRDKVGQNESIRRVDLATGQVTVLASSSKKTFQRYPDWRPFPSSGWAPTGSGTTSTSSISLAAAATDSEGTSFVLVLPAAQLHELASASDNLGDTQPDDAGLVPHDPLPPPSAAGRADRTALRRKASSAAAKTSDTDLVDLALTNFNASPLDDALLTDLAVTF